MTSSRTLAALTAGLLALGLLAGCAPTPEPKPTKTAAFASDEEAFAAAKKTYEEYTKALNAVDTTDPETFEPVFSWTMGDADAAIRKALSQLHAENVTMAGETKIASFKQVSVDAASGQVVLAMCVDVSETDTIDKDGKSLVPEGRSDLVPVRAQFSNADTSTKLKIASSDADTEHACSS
ncbi:hypothetical protein ACFVAE_00120 [Microbacterium sp. NPDC057659]|uniref:hypothetical protein n=1 Tax=Microbacterium sp. NPDC057659 TaxID=3346198 RepID=UPI0036723733